MSVRRRNNGVNKTQSNESVKSNDLHSVKPLNIDDNNLNDFAPATKGSGPIYMLRSGVSTLGRGFGNILKSGVSNLFGLKAVASFAKGGVNSIADATNLSTKVVTGVLVATLTLGTGTGAMVIANYHANNLLVKQEDYYDDGCVEDVNKMVVSGGGGPTGDAEEYALKAWAVAKAFGLSDEQAAGMLGNMQEESGMDPTTIEGIYDEPFDITAPQKAACVSNLPESLCDYTRTAMRQKYINSGFGIQAWTTSAGCTMAGASGSPRIISQAYEGTDGHFFPGIGLFGFTGPEGNALFNYAESTNGQYNWYDFDLQMAFIFDTTGGYARASWVESWKNQTVSSAADAAVQWNINFEGNASNFKGSEKAASAVSWYNRFKGTAGDTAYAQSIIALANTIQGGAQSSSYKKAVDGCAGAKTVMADNSDLARAAVSYAYETVSEGNGNDGTELYRYVHDAVFPGDGYYQSCDRGVGTAVRWSGYDDNFPPGNTSVQDAYLANSPSWEFLGEFTGDIDSLQPGDILITTAERCGQGHVVLYVSNEIVKEKFPSSDACFVSASFGERSPGCETWASGKFVGEGYYVYRNKQKSNPSQYTNVANGMSLNDR